jgi:Flp pilus assembly protein CpaB
MARRNTGGRLRAVVFLLASLGVAGVAVFGIWQVVRSYQAQLVKETTPIETVQVMVAAKDLYPGRTIVPEDLKPFTVPPDYVPDAVLKQVEHSVGRVPRERILTNEFIREERLADPAAGVGLNAIIPRGMRALSINISSGSAVSGFLNPGNYVDVIVTLKASDTGPQQTFTMMQAMTVLAVNTRLGDVQSTESSRSNSAKPSVTLAVTPEQAEKLTHAHDQATVTLALRNDIDVTNVLTNGAVVGELLGGENNEKRLTIPQWKARGGADSDGSLIIIKGSKEQTERVLE